MQTFIDHARNFRARAARESHEFERLAQGQAPLALFITCSDSRVIPSLITGSRPGELFELRTAGNIVPPYRLDRPSGEAATIEFAVQVLGVSDIVVCGHSHCGAVGALVRRDDLAAVPALRGWLADAVPAPPGQDGARPRVALPQDDYADAVQAHVLDQLDRLRGYPAVRDRLAAGRIGLHAWFYEVHTGAVLAHRSGAFLPL
ncbi:carbonic anhydrase [Actinomadura macrotermitis]|uniref:Carbonic anhydrase n=1 Tax=Actinomadura macrotermitis TaxID=2585200 RepID=A0A7K0BQQ7_9ACTN|nr:carbonic anhydrase [Actinomadura macrotermitis]MQY03499.1 Carbonic anhydrase 1 [Actinomadura macrotermitis]